MPGELDVVGIGNALVDVLVSTDAATVADCGLVKGSMMLMTTEEAEAIHARVGSGTERSGGSAANTVVGLASLGASTGYIGRVGDDRLGRVFADDIRALDIAFGAGMAATTPTGRCLILVTPDGDRTMCTSLGAAAELGRADVDDALVARARLTYLEGYLFDPRPAKEAFRHAIVVAHQAGRRVAMSLSDPFCVERHRDDFAALVADQLDLLFANEEEVCALTRTRDVADACRQLRRPGLTVSVTLGASGALVFSGHEEVQRVPAVPVEKVVDTTGAGDLYAAGFLFGMARGLDLATCARTGAIAAAEIISHMGARPEADLAEMVGPLV